MDNILTMRIGAFLKKGNPTEQEIIEAATMLLMLDPGRERAIYNGALRRPQALLPWIRTDLKKFYGIRKKGMTNADAEEFNSETVKLVEETLSTIPEGAGAAEDGVADTKQLLGKRADHDTLPDNIKALWDKNAQRWKELRKMHAQLAQMIGQEGYQPCDGNELCYQMRQVDNAIRADYKKYDEYKAEPEHVLTPEEQAQELNKKINKSRVLLTRTLKKEQLSDDDIEKLQDAVDFLISAKAKINTATIGKLQAAGITITAEQ